MNISYKWLAAMVLILGNLMSSLDQTIVNIAIPQLQRAFGADVQSVQWVVTSYLLAQGALIALTPYLSQRLGSKRTYLLTLGAFTIGSALCGLAGTLPLLIFFRILQGLGGAILLPLAFALILTIFPSEERGVATAISGIPFLVLPALGPIVGGYLLAMASWRIIFFLNVPIGLLAIILGAIILHETRTMEQVSFDLPGFLTSVYGLAAILYAFAQASTLGWNSFPVMIFLVSGGAALALFVGLELRTVRRGRRPLMDVRLFADRTFAAGSIAVLFAIASLFSLLFLLPIYLQTLRGLSALEAAFFLLPQALATIISTLVGGRLVDRLGDARVVIVPGFVLLLLGAFLLTRLTLLTPYWQFDLVLFVVGLAFGMIQQPLRVAAMTHIHGAQPVTNGSTLLTVSRAVAASLGLAVLATLVQTQTQIHRSQLAADPSQSLPGVLLQKQAFLLAMHDVFFIIAGLAMLGLLATALLQKKPPRAGEEAPLSATRSEGEISAN
ncbi:DHA2 family efflux MFS transporter permease subunit [Ktedonosporobacter rubrisoli]|nr:DHA2 family efflux MFS transporter permease subunit [Ktedonosporobacter rubrisoli]